MDHPWSLSNKLATLFAALTLSQSVRVSQARRHTDAGVAVPARQRLWERWIQRLAVRPGGGIPKINDAHQGVSPGCIPVRLVNQDWRLFYVKSLWFESLNKVHS